MTLDEAAWVREHVWTQAMRKTHRDVPGLYAVCACQYGLTSWCQHGDCGRCHRAAPQPGPAGYVCGRGGETPLVFPVPYEHPTSSATGRQESRLAMFWLADRVCRWVCPCPHHDGIGQGSLFDLAVSI